MMKLSLCAIGVLTLLASSSCAQPINVEETIPVDSEFGAIVTAVRKFVDVHNALLNTVIGKKGILSNLPAGAPVAAVLRALEGGVDTIAFALINAIQPNVPKDVAAGASIDQATGSSDVQSSLGGSGSVEGGASTNGASGDVSAAGGKTAVSGDISPSGNPSVSGGSSAPSAAPSDICQLTQQLITLSNAFTQQVLEATSSVVAAPGAAGNGQLVAAALRTIEGLVDTIAQGIIAQVPTCASTLNTVKSATR